MGPSSVAEHTNLKCLNRFSLAPVTCKSCVLPKAANTPVCDRGVVRRGGVRHGTLYAAEKMPKNNRLCAACAESHAKSSFWNQWNACLHHQFVIKVIKEKNTNASFSCATFNEQNTHCFE